jgi:hypothetical protein
MDDSIDETIEHVSGWSRLAQAWDVSPLFIAEINRNLRINILVEWRTMWPLSQRILINDWFVFQMFTRRRGGVNYRSALKKPQFFHLGFSSALSNLCAYRPLYCRHRKNHE